MSLGGTRVQTMGEENGGGKKVGAGARNDGECTEGKM
jgi:hypothetical protein